MPPQATAQAKRRLPASAYVPRPALRRAVVLQPKSKQSCCRNGTKSKRTRATERRIRKVGKVGKAPSEPASPSSSAPWLPNQIAQNAAARNEATFFTLKWQIVKITEAATARKIEQRHRRQPAGTSPDADADAVPSRSNRVGWARRGFNRQQVQAKINAKSKRKNWKLTLPGMWYHREGPGEGAENCSGLREKNRKNIYLTLSRTRQLCFVRFSYVWPFYWFSNSSKIIIT